MPTKWQICACSGPTVSGSACGTKASPTFDHTPANDSPMMLMSPDTLRKLECMRIEREAQYQTENTLLEELKQLNRDKLIQTIPIAAPDALFSSLLEQQTLAQQRLVGLQKEFGPEYPEVIKVNAQLKDL